MMEIPLSDGTHLRMLVRDEYLGIRPSLEAVVSYVSEETQRLDLTVEGCEADMMVAVRSSSQIRHSGMVENLGHDVRQHSGNGCLVERVQRRFEALEELQCSSVSKHGRDSSVILFLEQVDAPPLNFTNVFFHHGEEELWSDTCNAVVSRFRILNWQGCNYGDLECIADHLCQCLSEATCVSENRARRLQAKADLFKTIYPLGGLAALRVVHTPPPIPSEGTLLHIFMPIWNERVLLPQALTYWRTRVPGCKITLLDHCDNECSRDESVAIGKAFGCSIIEWRTSLMAKGRRDLNSLAVFGEIREHIWKAERERGTEWIALLDVDEFVDVNTSQLVQFSEAGTTILRGRGWQMVGQSLDLTEVTRGFRSTEYDKPCIFRPAYIDRLNPFNGLHFALPEPAERLVWASVDLFHYKFVMPTPALALRPQAIQQVEADEMCRVECWNPSLWSFYSERAQRLFTRTQWLESLEPCHRHHDWACNRVLPQTAHRIAEVIQDPFPNASSSCLLKIVEKIDRERQWEMQHQAGDWQYYDLRIDPEYCGSMARFEMANAHDQYRSFPFQRCDGFKLLAYRFVQMHWGRISAGDFCKEDDLWCLVGMIVANMRAQHDGHVLHGDRGLRGD